MSKKIELTRKKEVITLNKKEIEHIIQEWYTNGMMVDFLQNEDGEDLEEVLDVDYSINIKTIN